MSTKIDEKINEMIDRVYLKFDKLSSDIFKNNINKCVYHYTNTDSLLSIINTKSLWLSSSRHLNDGYEIIYTVNLIKKIFESKTFLTNYSKHTVQKLKDSIIDDLDNYLKMHSKKTFILSFTLEESSAGLWLAYNNGNGYKLGFSTYNLKKEIDILFKNQESQLFEKYDPFIRFGNVIYDLKKQESILLKYFEIYANAINEMEEIASNHRKEKVLWVGTWSTILYVLSAFFKDPSYSYENEARLLICNLIDDSKKDKYLAFRSQKNQIVPYYEIQFSQKFESFLKEIEIGPKNSTEYTLDTVQMLLNNSGNKKTKVFCSKIKLQ